MRQTLLFFTVIFLSWECSANPTDSAYTYCFSVQNHQAKSYLNFQLDSSWYFQKEHVIHENVTYYDFQNPTLNENMKMIHLDSDFKLADLGKSKLPWKVSELNFQVAFDRFRFSEYEQKMGYVTLDPKRKKAILNLKMLGISKGILLVYELDDQSSWMIWYPDITELKKGLLEGRIKNADEMIFKSFVPKSKHQISKSEESLDSIEVEAEFKGGYESLVKFIQSNLEIPDSFIDNASGKSNKYFVRVIIRFVVEKDGSLSDFFVDNMSNELFPTTINSCIQLYRQMPNWDPAIRKGVPVRTLLYLPIKFEVV